jgi:hypothetical protein
VGKKLFFCFSHGFTRPHNVPLKQRLSDCRCLGQTDSSRYARVWIANSGVKKIQSGALRRRYSDRIGGRSSELLDGAHGEAGDETIDEKIVQNGDGNAGDETTGHEGSPEVYVAVS